MSSELRSNMIVTMLIICSGYFCPHFSAAASSRPPEMRMQPTRPRTLTVQISTRAASDTALDSRELNPCPVDDDKLHTMNLLFHSLQRWKGVSSGIGINVTTVPAAPAGHRQAEISARGDRMKYGTHIGCLRFRLKAEKGTIYEKQSQQPRSKEAQGNR